MSSQPLTPVLVIRWVQLRLNVWFTEQAASPLALVTPDLQRLYRDFRLEVPWQPSIPAAFTVRPRPVASTPAGAPTAPRQAATLSTSAATPAQAFVANPSQKPELLPWKDLPGTLHQYLRPPGGTPVPPPKNYAGGANAIQVVVQPATTRHPTPARSPASSRGAAGSSPRSRDEPGRGSPSARVLPAPLKTGHPCSVYIRRARPSGHVSRI